MREIERIAVGKEPGQDKLHLIIEFRRGRKPRYCRLDRIKALQLINDLCGMTE